MSDIVNSIVGGISSLFGGGSSNQTGGGYYLTGGGANAPFQMGPTAFDLQAIDTSVGSNQQAIQNRYSQLGLGGAKPTPAPAPAPAAGTGTPPTLAQIEAIDPAYAAQAAINPGLAKEIYDALAALRGGGAGNINTGAGGPTDPTLAQKEAIDPAYAAQAAINPTLANQIVAALQGGGGATSLGDLAQQALGGVGGTGDGSATGGGGATAGGGWTGGSTMEQQDLTAAGTAGDALLGQEQTADVGQAALNPALQPPINTLLGVQSPSGSSSNTGASALGTLVGSGLKSLTKTG